jgi:hypothetical protein
MSGEALSTAVSKPSRFTRPGMGKAGRFTVSELDVPRAEPYQSFLRAIGTASSKTRLEAISLKMNSAAI